MVWYSGNTSTSVTWGPLLTAIEDSGQREYGRELRAELAMLGMCVCLVCFCILMDRAIIGILCVSH